jgi:hypothetical protein
MGKLVKMREGEYFVISEDQGNGLLLRRFEGYDTGPEADKLTQRIIDCYNACDKVPDDRIAGLASPQSLMKIWDAIRVCGKLAANDHLLLSKLLNAVRGTR